MTSIASSRRSAGVACLEPLEGRRLFAVSPSVLDVAVVYTASAKNSMGGVHNLLQHVRRAVADTNAVFANSAVDAALRLVSVSEIAYAESRNLSTDLTRLQQKGDGFLDQAHAVRDAAGADLVHLLVGDGDDGGRAYQLDDPSRSWADYGFAVTQARYTVSEYIFAHETMHNLGAGHDHADHTHRRIDDAYGLAVKSGSQTVHTLLGPGTRIPYLTNPNVSWRGQKLGAAAGSAEAKKLGHGADNARVVRQFAPLVAANRKALVADTAAPLAGLHQMWVNPAGNTLTIEARLADDSAVNVATLDGGDLRVAGPNGFGRPATFVSVDRASNGAQRIARYKVDIAGYPTDPAAYAVSVNAGQIKDVGGRSVAAGTLSLGGNTALFADRAGSRLHTAMDLGVVNGTHRRLVDALTTVDASNNYRFTLNAASTITAKLTNLSADAQLLLVKDANANGYVESGDVIYSSLNTGTKPEQIKMSLQAGTYTLWATPANGGQATYSLSLQSSGATVKPPPAPAASPAAGSISGHVYRDNNGNAARDSWEANLAGWKVYADVNSNGRFDSGTDAVATTNTSGYYKLANLQAGRSYAVRSIDQTGYRRTSAAAHTVNLASGQNLTNRNFGHTPRALVSGAVYADANRNKLRDAGETGLPGWRVYLDKNNNSRYDAGEFTTLTDSAGNWQIRDALAGSYVVRIVNQTGHAATTPTNGFAVTLAKAQVVGGKHFGVRRV